MSRQALGIALVHDERDLADALVGLAQLDAAPLGERNNIIKRIHQGLAEQQIERSVSNYVLEQKDPARPIIGRLVARGLDDELRETAYAVKRVGKIALIMHQRYAQGLAAHQWMLLTNGPAQSAYPIIARFSQVYTIQLSPSRLTSPRRDALAPVRISTQVPHSC